MILSVYFYVFAFLTFLREFGDGKEVVIRRKETGDYLQDSTQKECTQYGRLASWNAGPSNICMCKQKATFFSTNDGDVGCYTGMEENAECQLRFKSNTHSIYTVFLNPSQQTTRLESFNNSNINSSECQPSTITSWSPDGWKDASYLRTKFRDAILSISWINSDIKGKLFKVPITCEKIGIQGCAYFKVDGESTVTIIPSTTTTQSPVTSSGNKTTDVSPNNENSSNDNDSERLSIALGITSALLVVLIVLIALFFIHRRRTKQSSKIERKKSKRKSFIDVDNVYEDIGPGGYSYTYAKSVGKKDEMQLSPSRPISSGSSLYTDMNRKSGMRNSPRQNYPIHAAVPDLPSAQHPSVNRQSSGNYLSPDDLPVRERYSSLLEERFKDKDNYASLDTGSSDYCEVGYIDADVSSSGNGDKTASTAPAAPAPATATNNKNDTELDNKESCYDSVADPEDSSSYVFAI